MTLTFSYFVHGWLTHGRTFTSTPGLVLGLPQDRELLMLAFPLVARLTEQVVVAHLVVFMGGGVGCSPLSSASIPEGIGGLLRAQLPLVRLCLF